MYGKGSVARDVLNARELAAVVCVAPAITTASRTVWSPTQLHELGATHAMLPRTRARGPTREKADQVSPLTRQTTQLN